MEFLIWDDGLSELAYNHAFQCNYSHHYSRDTVAGFAQAAVQMGLSSPWSFWADYTWFPISENIMFVEDVDNLDFDSLQVFSSSLCTVHRPTFPSSRLIEV